ncbi:MAG: sigma-70 family RNA polymerase sigma factor [Oscillospiraceae bacterium]|nr:sigma-70 family RNA polymerase sigma factor [Oscillospiraceae bacterium]
MKYEKIKDLKKKYDIVELWRNYEEDRTIENRNKLVEHYLYLLYKPVKNIYPICRNTQEMSDIFQSAVIGLIEAIEFYSKDRNAAFKTFSRWRIHGSIIDYLRKSSLIALPYKVRKKINEDRLKSEDENIDFENPYRITSLDYINENYENQSIMDTLQTDVNESPDIIIEEKIMLEDIHKALEHLPFDEYTTVIQYYFLGRTLEQIAQKLQMTRSGVWQVRKRAINSIRKMVEAT